MKRSEMVQKLDDALMQMKPPATRVEATENILAIVESLGMLPPVEEADLWDVPEWDPEIEGI